ncbi:hypothetical protein Pmar_PMAR019571 [Perkinsus marinus ATCC 50983]|uniref:Uncharacterized protein n=1 Tax=Perkinsus marinus (strain ATCC 50983 / TXsc) TaxID=423536 RepID=C5LGG8_PERM5|nr:hypothetical protein Pmar_PMAR019571 [Perkinsus marinus ATCC 50983]EER04154.1 hypothetical protein Pmar_PMAR019571 [Perkinsus marinus ATCC 50983]|eukprot:XP_002772338.1 hypothetical protein Pmar_PMAR019571 [Perkinsus marinus ATCC 50983]
MDRGNRRRRIRAAELVLRRPRPPRLLPSKDEVVQQATIPVDKPCKNNNNEESTTKECIDESADNGAVLTPSTNTDSPASNKGSLRSSMLECLSFELSSSSAASDCGDDEVFFESFISDDDTSHRID